MPTKKLENYILHQTLGKGAFAKVKLGQNSQTGELVAIKIMMNSDGADAKEAMSQIMNEVEKLSTLHHLNVLNVIEPTKQGKIQSSDGSTKDVLYVVLELAKGGELFDYLMETGKFGEKMSRFYFRQMIEGIEHIHSKGLTHRDLKPENLLFDDKFNVKIADFGFAAPLEGNDGSGVQRTYLGTPFYMAPEIHEKKTYNGEKVDLFALGIILFILMSKNPPFRVADKRVDRLYQFLVSGKEQFFWKLHGRQLEEGEAYFTPEFRDLFQKLMQYDPADRPSIQEIKDHPWYNGTSVTHKEAVTELMSRNKLIQAAKEQARKEKEEAKATVVQRGGARAYRGSDGEEESKEMDQSTFEAVNKEFVLESKTYDAALYNDAFVLFSQSPVAELLTEAHYFCAENKLEMKLDEAKCKVTIRTPAKEGDDTLFEIQENEFVVKVFKNEAAEGQVALDIQHVSGSRLDFMATFSKFKKALAAHLA